MNNRVLWAIMPVATLLFSCQKEQLEQIPASSPKSYTEEHALDFEIYEPNVEDEYAEMRDGLIAIFNETNPGGKTGINRAIWLYEAGLSELLTDSIYNDGDSTLTTERSVSFTLSDGEITDEDFIDAFTTDYNASLQFLEDNEALNPGYSLTDVQFLALSGNQLELKVVTYYWLNGFNNQYSGSGTPTVPPATFDGRAGTTLPCGNSSQNLRVWDSVQNQVRAVLPPRLGPSSNNWHFSSIQNSGHREVDGSFLVGRSNSLHHPEPAYQTDCVYTNEQDDYAQAMVDQIYNDLLIKQYDWYTVNHFRVYRNLDSHTPEVDWRHYGILQNYLYPPITNRLNADDLF